MDASFDNKLDSQYFSDEKLVMPILPHVYTNIISEIFKKDNLYKKDTGGGKLKKETENENELLENKIKVNSNDSISFSYNEKKI